MSRRRCVVVPAPVPAALPAATVAELRATAAMLRERAGRLFPHAVNRRGQPHFCRALLEVVAAAIEGYLKEAGDG